SLSLGSFCLTVCLYPGVSEFVFGKLSFSSLILALRTDVGLGVSLGLGSFCLAAFAYSDDSEIVPGKIGLQMLSVYLHSPYGRGLGCANARLVPTVRTEACSDVSLGLGSFC